MRAGYLFLAFLCAIVFWLLVFAAVASAHGTHNSFIKPAYDCYHNPDGQDSRGNVEITHDLDLAKYVVWKCKCVWTEMGYLVCWWSNEGEFTWKKNAVRRARELTDDPRYTDAVVRSIWVQWSAFHRGIGCNTHYDQRGVISWFRKG